MSTDTVEASVARGAALLDEKLPGWVDRIDLDRLDLGSDCNCILGQEYADVNYGIPYLYGLDELGMDGLGAAEHGFDTFDAGISSPPEYDHLTAEWRRVILARRGEAT